MSYRELRNFKEIMCTLGYPRLISIENFKVPHFELVADILVWLCHRYDKNMEVLDEIRTCDIATRGPEVVARVKRWVVLRRWRLALAHTRISLCLLAHYRAVVATRAWLFAARTLRAYNRSFKRLYIRLRQPRMAARIQARARALAPRRAFLRHLAAVAVARRYSTVRARRAFCHHRAAVWVQRRWRTVVARRAFVALRCAAKYVSYRLRLRQRLLLRLMRERYAAVAPQITTIQATWRGVQDACVLGRRADSTRSWRPKTRRGAGMPGVAPIWSLGGAHVPGRLQGHDGRECGRRT